MIRVGTCVCWGQGGACVCCGQGGWGQGGVYLSKCAVMADSLRPSDIHSATLEVILDDESRKPGRIISVFYQDGDKRIRVAKTDPDQALPQKLTFNLAPACYDVVLEEPNERISTVAANAVGAETVRVKL